MNLWLRLLAPALLCGLAACEVSPCDEFAAPFDRAPGHCPAKPQPQATAADADAKVTRYCYSTLGQVDCFTTPQPGRTGYLGSYTPKP